MGVQKASWPNVRAVSRKRNPDRHHQIQIQTNTTYSPMCHPGPKELATKRPCGVLQEHQLVAKLTAFSRAGTGGAEAHALMATCGHICIRHSMLFLFCINFNSAAGPPIGHRAVQNSDRARRITTFRLRASNAGGVVNSRSNQRQFDSSSLCSKTPEHC